MVFLLETKADVVHMEFVKSFIKFNYRVVVEAKGSVGGLCMLWKEGLSISEVEFDKNLIAAKVSNQCTDWLLVGFY